MVSALMSMRRRHGTGGSLDTIALITRGIRGILSGFSREHTQGLAIDLGKFTVAGLSTYFHELKVDRANFHGLYNVRLAMEKMQAIGCRRTGLVVEALHTNRTGLPEHPKEVLIKGTWCDRPIAV